MIKISFTSVLQFKNIDHLEQWNIRQFFSQFCVYFVSFALIFLIIDIKIRYQDITWNLIDNSM